MIEIAELTAIIIGIIGAVGGFIISLKVRACRVCCCSSECNNSVADEK